MSYPQRVAWNVKSLVQTLARRIYTWPDLRGTGDRRNRTWVNMECLINEGHEMRDLRQEEHEIMRYDKWFMIHDIHDTAKKPSHGRRWIPILIDLLLWHEMWDTCHMGKSVFMQDDVRTQRFDLLSGLNFWMMSLSTGSCCSWALKSIILYYYSRVQSTPDSRLQSTLLARVNGLLQ